MIRFENVTKIFRIKGDLKMVARDINAVFPTGRSIGLLGRNGAGKSTMMKMIAGTMVTTRGRIISDGTISWPVGFAGSFHPMLTGAQNVRFVARIYGVETDALIDFVEDFAQLGPHFHMPFGSYSSGMRSRLAFGTSMGIRFDTYLVDEVTSVGDASFKKRSEEVFLERMSQSGAVVVSHSLGLLKRLCTMGAVLEGARLTVYEDIDEAIAHHLENMERAAPNTINIGN